MVGVINLVAQLSKKFILPKWGTNGVHIFVFGLALIYQIVSAIMVVHPTVGVFIEHSVAMLVATVGTYEVFWKKLGDQTPAPVPPEIASNVA